ncbi:MAG: DUF1848 domain-containing protein [Magnetospiraceae bacterium]
MIISASYRTDIPAFYADWFRARLAAGVCWGANPYSGKPYRVSLRPEDVTGYVFWTRNPAPFADALKAVTRQELPFIVQMTITGYPRALDAATIDPARAVALMQELRETYGPRALVWRYDPIVLSDLTPPDWHRENLARLAAALRGAVDEVVVSFLQVYRKTARNLNASGLDWQDPTPMEKQALLAELLPLAAAQGLRLSLCGQRDLLIPGVQDAACVEAARLADIAGKPLVTVGKSHRAGCGCAPSRDIGDYDTCPHGCVYCYAVRHRDLAKRRFQRHDPRAESLRAAGP